MEFLFCAPNVAFQQNDANGCCFSSLDSYFIYSVEYVAAVDIARRIKRPYLFKIMATQAGLNFQLQLFLTNEVTKSSSVLDKRSYNNKKYSFDSFSDIGDIMKLLQLMD